MCRLSIHVCYIIHSVNPPPHCRRRHHHHMLVGTLNNSKYKRSIFYMESDKITLNLFNLFIDPHPAVRDGVRRTLVLL